jgi:hypothetical protein
MNKDVQFLAEAYDKVINEVKASPSNFSGNPVKPVGNFANSPIPKGYDAMQSMINQKLAAKEQSNELNVQPGDFGDDYNEVKSLIDQLISYGLDRNVLKAVLQYAEEVGYTGESVDNLIKLIQHFNSRGVQDS